MKNLDFYFYSVLKNEDANPYVGSDVIAVADGLGGSGSAVHTLRPEQYETLRQVLYKTVLPGNGWREDPHLSAYFESLFRPMTDSHPDTSALWASRIVMARFVYAAAKCRNSLGDLADPQARRRLAGFLEGGLRDVAAEFRLEKGRFGGQQLLPTTFASVFLREEEEGFVTAEAVWAGDSRCYALTGTGLKPLSVDDEDGTGAITNLFCVGEKEAVLHYRRFHLKKPCAVFACSDGVFDPYAGHEHLCVENVLLREISRSTSAGELRSRLHDHYKRIHADDATMAFRAVGFDSYAAMKRFFAPRAADVARMYDRLCRFRSHLEVAACSEDEVAGYVRSRTSDKFEAVVAAVCEALRTRKEDPACASSVRLAYEAAYARRKEETDGACRQRRDRLLGEIRAQFEANPASAHLFFARSKKLAGVGKKCEREAAKIVELARALCGAQKEYEAKDGAVKRLYREYAESKRVAREHADRLYSAYRTFRADPARRAEGVRAFDACRYIVECADFGREPDAGAPRAEDARFVQPVRRKRKELKNAQAALPAAEKEVRKRHDAYMRAVAEFLSRYAGAIDAGLSSLFGAELLKTLRPEEEVPREPDGRAVLQDVLDALAPEKARVVDEIVRSLAASPAQPSAADALYNGTRLSKFRLFYAMKGEENGEFAAFGRELPAFEEKYESLLRAPTAVPAAGSVPAAAKAPAPSAVPATGSVPAPSAVSAAANAPAEPGGPTGGPPAE